MKMIDKLAAVIVTVMLPMAAHAADLDAHKNASKQYLKAPVKDIANDWTGLYAGVNGGAAWGSSSQRDTAIGGGRRADGDYNMNGGFVGGTVGYNWQFANMLAGLEGDLDWAPVSGSSSVCGTNHECGTKLKGLGTVRGRIGSVIGNTLLFATGGLAVGNINAYDVSGPASATKTKAGWTVGGGIENRLSGPWSAKVEYAYTAFGHTDYFTLADHTPESIDLKSHMVKFGLNYAFGK